MYRSGEPACRFKFSRAWVYPREVSLPLQIPGVMHFADLHMWAIWGTVPSLSERTFLYPALYIRGRYPRHASRDIGEPIFEVLVSRDSELRCCRVL